MVLQRLVVTPLQKTHAIEPYVAGLGSVHNDRDMRSMLRHISPGQYQSERADCTGGITCRT